MKRALISTAAIAAIATLSSGCSSPPLRAPRNADGSQMTMIIHVDRNLTEDLTDVQVREHQDAGEFLEGELGGYLARYGWATKMVRKKKDAEPQMGPGVFLVEVVLTDCRPGHATTRTIGRLVGGFGGRMAAAHASARIGISHRVLDDQKRSIHSGSAGAKSTRSWRAATTHASKSSAYQITRALDELFGVGEVGP